MSKKLILETKDVTKVYTLGNGTVKVKIEALRGISVKICEREFISIIGKSGSGKSTLMHTIGLLDTPTSGKVYLRGKDVSHLEESELAKIRNQEIGFVFQAFNLLQRTTVMDNVLLPLRYSQVPKDSWTQKATEVIELVGLSDRSNNKSNELSGGQKQRVAIARALVNNPSIVLADEPTGNLDSKTGKDILELFHKLNRQGKTIVIVTHDMDIAKKTKRRIYIKDGIISETT